MDRLEHRKGKAVLHFQDREENLSQEKLWRSDRKNRNFYLAATPLIR